MTKTREVQMTKGVRLKRSIMYYLCFLIVPVGCAFAAWDSFMSHGANVRLIQWLLYSGLGVGVGYWSGVDPTTSFYFDEPILTQRSILFQSLSRQWDLTQFTHYKLTGYRSLTLRLYSGDPDRGNSGRVLELDLQFFWFGSVIR